MQTVGFEVRVTGSYSPVKYCTKSVFPQSRAHHAACQHENWIYLLSGKDGNITLKDFWRFNIGTHGWEKLSYRGDLPHHLQGHTLISFKKLLLLFGGEFGDALTESSLWIINPDLGYVRKACLDVGSERPCVRRYHSAVIFRDSMYVYGGYVDVKGSSSEFWRYDVEDEEWELLLPQQPSHDLPGRRYGHTAVVYKQSMWLFGGLNNLVPKQDLWSYSFISERWERIKYKVGPPALTGHSAAVIGSHMIIYGGETSREPVNQVWTFDFCTLKWTQVIMIGQTPPSRTLHVCVTVNPAIQIEQTVKARSTPYLQNKTKDQIKRPKSSPGYRPNLEPVHKDNQKILIFERTNSAIEMSKSDKDLNLESCIVCKNKITVPYCRANSDVENVLHIQPSPSENSKDIVPLVPPKTDFNFNNVNMLDKDAVRNGIDNPGISDSTEKLIEESQIRKFSNGDNLTSKLCDIMDCDEIEVNSAEKRKLCFECAHSAKNNSLVKRNRLDPELILEDIEFQDCFPFNIQVPFPITSQVSLQNMSREPEDGLETIELEDFRNYDNFHESQRHDHVYLNESCLMHNNENTEQLNSDKVKNHRHHHHHQQQQQQSYRDKNRQQQQQQSYNDKSQQHQSINYDIFSVEKSAQDRQIQGDGSEMSTRNLDNTGSHDCDRSRITQEEETSFQADGPRQVYRQHVDRKPAVNKKEAPERPYLLVVGGRDKQAVNFTIKPLSLVKLQLSVS